MPINRTKETQVQFLNDLAEKHYNRIASDDGKRLFVQSNTCLRCKKVANVVYRIATTGNGCYRELRMTDALRSNYCRRCGLDRIRELDERDGKKTLPKNRKATVEPGKCYRIKGQYDRVAKTLEIVSVFRDNPNGSTIVRARRVKHTAERGGYVYFGNERVYSWSNASTDVVETTEHRGHAIPGKKEIRVAEGEFVEASEVRVGDFLVGMFGSPDRRIVAVDTDFAPGSGDSIRIVSEASTGRHGRDSKGGIFRPDSVLRIRRAC